MEYNIRNNEILLLNENVIFDIIKIYSRHQMLLKKVELVFRQ